MIICVQMYWLKQMFVTMVLRSEKFGSKKNADFDKLNLLIRNTDWNELILGASDINKAAENFSNTFLT